MADEPKVTPAIATPPVEPTTPTSPLGNDPTARNPDGSIKDPSSTPASTEPSKESKLSTEPAKSDDKKPAAPTGAPEKYADFKAPEGFEFDPKAVEAAAPVFKELGLTQDQAQSLMDLHAKLVTEAQKAPLEEWVQKKIEWRTEAFKSDLGNGVDNLKSEVLKSISDAINSLPHSDKFRQALDYTGAGDHPAVIEAINDWGKRLAEGTAVRGAGPAATGQARPGSGPKSAAAAMYPHLPSSA